MDERVILCGQSNMTELRYPRWYVRLWLRIGIGAWARRVLENRRWRKRTSGGRQLFAWKR